MSIAWMSEEQRPRDQRATPLVRVPGRRPEQYRLLGPGVGVELHWVGSRSRPHLTEQCPHCADGSESIRPHWYYPAAYPALLADAGTHIWKPCVLSVAEAGQADLLRLIEETGQPLERLVVLSWHLDTQLRRQVVSLLRVDERVCGIPTFSVIPILSQMWRIRPSGDAATLPAVPIDP